MLGGMDLAAKIATAVDAKLAAHLDARIDALIAKAIDRALGGDEPAAPAAPPPAAKGKPAGRRGAKAPAKASKGKRTRPKARAAAKPAEAQGAPGAKLSAIAEQVLAALASGPKSATGLLESVKATKGGIHGACQRLVVQGLVTRVEQGKSVLYGLASASTPT